MFFHLTNIGLKYQCKAAVSSAGVMIRITGINKVCCHSWRWSGATEHSIPVTCNISWWWYTLTADLASVAGVSVAEAGRDDTSGAGFLRSSPKHKNHVIILIWWSCQESAQEAEWCGWPESEWRSDWPELRWWDWLRMTTHCHHRDISLMMMMMMVVVDMNTLMMMMSEIRGWCWAWPGPC